MVMGWRERENHGDKGSISCEIKLEWRVWPPSVNPVLINCSFSTYPCLTQAGVACFRPVWTTSVYGSSCRYPQRKDKIKVERLVEKRRLKVYHQPMGKQARASCFTWNHYQRTREWPNPSLSLPHSPPPSNTITMSMLAILFFITFFCLQFSAVNAIGVMHECLGYLGTLTCQTLCNPVQIK